MTVPRFVWGSFGMYFNLSSSILSLTIPDLKKGYVLVSLSDIQTDILLLKRFIRNVFPVDKKVFYIAHFLHGESASKKFYRVGKFRFLPLVLMRTIFEY